MKARWFIAAVLGIAIMLVARPASAQVCSFSISALDFGSINLAANTTFTSTATLSGSCTGAASATVRACPNIDVGSGGSSTGNPRFLVNGATQLNFNLYQDGAYASVWGSNLWGFAGSYPSPTIDIALDSNGNGAASRTIYGQIWSGQPTLPAGLYASSFSGTQAQVAYAYSTSGTCATIGNSLASNASFTVTATNATICSVSVGTLSFGATGVLRSNVDGTTSVSVTCTNQAPYTVALDGGLSGATDPTQRKMTHSGVSVTYGLYQDASRLTPWGSSTGVNTVAQTGSGLAQSFTVYGRVPPQTTPAPGNYADTVVLTVSY